MASNDSDHAKWKSGAAGARQPGVRRQSARMICIWKRVKTTLMVLVLIVKKIDLCITTEGSQS